MRIFALTGAGISAESGLGTFRDPGGIWERFDPMKLATLEGFKRDPVAVHAFYNARRRNMIAAEPNAAHLALAHLQAGLRARGDSLFICTQNIDDLHERAGAGEVLHMHGELLRTRCLACDRTIPWRADLSVDLVCETCGRPGGLRPDVVWFGEMPHGMAEIETTLIAADLFIAIGTSGAVYPAAEFVEIARDQGILTLEFNLHPPDNARLFDEAIHGPATETVPAFVDRLLGERIRSDQRP